MPFPPIDLSRIQDAQIKQAIGEGLALREREVARLEADNTKVAAELQAARTDADATRRKFAELSKQLVEVQAALSSREADLKSREADLRSREADLKSTQKALAAATEQTEGLRKQVESAKAQIAELLGRIEPAPTPRPKIAVEQLVNGFRSQIEGINAEVMKKNVGGSMLVEGCEVEIKGGLDVSDGIRISTLSESALGANTVSTLRFTLRPAPVVRISDDE